jgi:SagB-type dehydrogenase family enzyme
VFDDLTRPNGAFPKMDTRAALEALVSPKVLDDVRSAHRRANFYYDGMIGHAVGYTDASPEVLAGCRHEELTIGISQPVHDPDTGVEPPAWARRRSNLRYDDRRDNFKTLELLLRRAFGTRSFADTSRFYPSAGALYPIETFVAIFGDRLNGAPPAGIYHFRPRSASLEPIRACGNDELLSMIGNKTETAPAFAVVYMMDVVKALFKYRYRGYVFALLEAGSMYHQADLVATELGLSNCVIGGFADSRVSRVCGTDPAYLLPIVLQFFGPRPPA